MPKATGKAAHRQNRNNIEIEQRRLKVASALLQGLTYRQIARQLNVSVGTVAADRRAIVAEWQRHYTKKANEWIDIQLRRLDVMLNAIWADAIGAGEGKEPSLPHQDRVVRIIERQERLLGIGAGSPVQNPAPKVNFALDLRIDDVTEDIKALREWERQEFERAKQWADPSPN